MPHKHLDYSNASPITASPLPPLLALFPRRAGLERGLTATKVAESKHPPTLRIDSPAEAAPLARTQTVPPAFFNSPLSPLGNPPMLSPGGKGFLTSDSKESAYQVRTPLDG